MGKFIDLTGQRFGKLVVIRKSEVRKNEKICWVCYLIEYDGVQHFKYRKNTGGWNNEENFNRTVKRDSYKNHWCLENNIPLIRIPYTHLKDIELEDLILESSQYLVTEEKDNE